MNFFNKIGVMAISSRLRMLSEKMTKQSTELYKLYGIELQPKWFPLFYTLAQGEERTITEIARNIGHSHPSVSKIAREMSKAGLLHERKGKKDARKNVISLSEKGMAMKENILPQYEDVTTAINKMLDQTTHNLWKAIDEWEYLLDQKDLLERVRKEKKLRETKEVQIVDYQPKYKEAYKALNVDWITTHFVMEGIDKQVLDNPETDILNKGGHIFIALYKGEPIGTCSLKKLKDDQYDFELTKMAVWPKAQGKGIGWLLGRAVVDKAKELGGKTLYLESNTKLKAAISLYHKLGFKKVPHRPSAYGRSNIQMMMEL
jgi:DNA-binding MarR family transcriptional regulator/GNAT superfamily N-acetyltransferase